MKKDITPLPHESRINFLKVIPNSQFYSDLHHLETSIKYIDILGKDHVLVGIQNTIKMGYKLVAPQIKRKKKK